MQQFARLQKIKNLIWSALHARYVFTNLGKRLPADVLDKPDFPFGVQRKLYTKRAP